MDYYGNSWPGDQDLTSIQIVNFSDLNHGQLDQHQVEHASANILGDSSSSNHVAIPNTGQNSFEANNSLQYSGIGATTTIGEPDTIVHHNATLLTNNHTVGNTGITEIAGNSQVGQTDSIVQHVDIKPHFTNSNSSSIGFVQIQGQNQCLESNRPIKIELMKIENQQQIDDMNSYSMSNSIYGLTDEFNQSASNLNSHADSNSSEAGTCNEAIDFNAYMANYLSIYQGEPIEYTKTHYHAANAPNSVHGTSRLQQQLLNHHEQLQVHQQQNHHLISQNHHNHNNSHIINSITTTQHPTIHHHPQQQQQHSMNNSFQQQSSPNDFHSNLHSHSNSVHLPRCHPISSHNTPLGLTYQGQIPQMAIINNYQSHQEQQGIPTSSMSDQFVSSTFHFQSNNNFATPNTHQQQKQMKILDQSNQMQTPILQSSLQQQLQPNVSMRALSDNPHQGWSPVSSIRQNRKVVQSSTNNFNMNSNGNLSGFGQVTTPKVGYGSAHSSNGHIQSATGTLGKISNATPGTSGGSSSGHQNQLSPLLSPISMSTSTLSSPQTPPQHHVKVQDQMLDQVNEVMLKCNKCERQYNNKRSLTKHLKDDHNERGKKHGCTLCTHRDETKNGLRLHFQENHAGEKPHKCDKCQFATSDHNSFRRHKLRHDGLYPYNCPFCAYKSIQSCSYKDHLKKQHRQHVEIDNYLFSCEQCGFTTISRAKLNSHRTTCNKSDVENQSSVAASSSDDNSNTVNLLPPTSTIQAQVSLEPPSVSPQSSMSKPPPQIPINTLVIKREI